MDGDDIGKWLQQQKQSDTWTRLLPEQQERLSTLGMQPARPAPAPAVKGGRKTSTAFKRGVQALAQYIDREGHHRVPRGHSEEIAVEGEAAPVAVRLGVFMSNTKARRDKLTHDQRTALTALGIDWA